MLKILQIGKNILILFPFLLILSPLRKLLLFFGNTIDMVMWANRNKNNFLIKNPLTLKRDYFKRLNLYEQVLNYYSINQKNISYLEFGVASGSSFNWWVKKNENDNSRFYGFDTFEGLPEDWGLVYKKGDMTFPIPPIADHRVSFVKGLFQDTLLDFFQKNKDDIQNSELRIIHCDADLYSSTIFILSQLYPYLKKGDIIFFDEFNAPMHEYKAFKEFTESFYVKLKPIAQVNTFFQIAFVVE